MIISHTEFLHCTWAHIHGLCTNDHEATSQWGYMRSSRLFIFEQSEMSRPRCYVVFLLSRFGNLIFAYQVLFSTYIW